MNPWDKILIHLNGRLNPQTFTTWFRPARLESVKENLLAVRVPNPTFQKWLSGDGRPILEEAQKALELSDYQIDFIVAPQDAPGGAPAQTRLDFDSTDSQLNPRYLFDAFVVGSSNQLAHAAAQAVADQPAKMYNPLFLYGGVGLGKTHLMQAVGHRVRQSNRALRVSYLSAEAFTNEVIQALRFERMVGFRDKFRNTDILLVDDIQFLAGKERTQEEFFHTFNSLYDAQKQIVISSDAPPKEIPTLEERLRSRFEWGLIADIQPPDLETKIAILMKQADRAHAALPLEVAEYIAKGIRSNIRELEGALTRLLAYASLQAAPMTLPLAEQVLKNLFAQQEKRVSIEAVQRRVADHFALQPHILKAKSNAHAVAYPRQVAMYLTKQLTGASLPEIGRAFGGKHHTTVLHSVNKISRLSKSNKDLAALLRRLAEALS